MSLVWFCSPTYLMQPQPTWQKVPISLTCRLHCLAAVKAPAHLPEAAVSLAPCAAHLHPKLYWGGTVCVTSIEGPCAHM